MGLINDVLLQIGPKKLLAQLVVLPCSNGKIRKGVSWVSNHYPGKQNVPTFGPSYK